MHVNRVVCGISAALLLLSIATLWLHLRKDVTAAAPEHTQVLSIGTLPLVFEANRGQTNSQVEFLARGSGATVFLTSRGFVLKLCNDDEMPGTSTCDAQEMRLVGANPDPEISGLEPLPGVTSYFIGNDPKEWHAGIPHFARVRYEKVYEGVDLFFHGNNGQIEYDFIVEPGSDPTTIRLAFPGARGLAVDDDGNLVVSTPEGRLLQRAPIIYQVSEGARNTVQGGYALEEESLVGFEVGAYDEKQPLIIDPILSYSTFLGGTGTDSAGGIAVDQDGNVYVAGQTDSADFPTVEAFDGHLSGTSDIFVAKIAPYSGTLLFSTFLGGSGGDDLYDLALDSEGTIYLTGSTSSSDFPTVDDLPFTEHDVVDAFVVKMNSSGSALISSSYLGGSSYDYGHCIAVGDNGHILVAGLTRSSDFPTISPLYGSLNGTHGDIDSEDLFITSLANSAQYYYWSTYLGGSERDRPYAIDVDGSGHVYISGRTSSTDFPTKNAEQAVNKGFSDGFVAQVHLMGWSLGYSTYLGGTSSDEARDLTVDRDGNVYVASKASSSGFPTRDAYQPLSAGGSDVAITQFAADGSIVFSTFLGGSGADSGSGIGLDRAGNIYVAGETTSTNFPTLGAFQGQKSDLRDLIFAQLTPGGRALAYSTHLGGTGNEDVSGFTVDEEGASYAAGRTLSTDFPTVLAVQPELAGGNEAFVARVTKPLDFFIAATPRPARAVSVDQYP